MGRQVLQLLRAIECTFDHQTFPLEKTEVTPELLAIAQLAPRCRVLVAHLGFSDVHGCKKHFRDMKMEN